MIRILASVAVLGAAAAVLGLGLYQAVGMVAFGWGGAAAGAALGVSSVVAGVLLLFAGLAIAFPVRSTDGDAHDEIIEGDDGERLATGACIRCGYSMRGLARRGRCPECGFTYDLDDRDAAVGRGARNDPAVDDRGDA